MKNPVNDLLQAVYLSKKAGKKFFREVQSALERMRVIASGAHFNDVSRFCAMPNRGAAKALILDLVFKLGEFYALVTSLKSCILINKFRERPTRAEPVEIQHRKLLSYIDLGIKLDNNKYNLMLPHFYVMTKWIVNNFVFVIKSIYLAFTC